jgi:glucose dehydrogenase
MVALDAKTGQELWKTQVVDFTQGSVITSPPTIVKNLVITGFGGGEYGARGYISALDQDTGKEVWRLWTVPGPGEPGNDTWKGDSWKFGGATAWLIGSYDPALNLLYYGTSNPVAVGRIDPRAGQRQLRQRHQPLLVLHARHQSRHRQARVALPEHATRRVGLRRRERARAGRRPASTAR